jgi:hypothetical protein
MVGLILVPGDRLVVPFSAALAARRFEQEVRVPAELQRSDPQPTGSKQRDAHCDHVCDDVYGGVDATRGRCPGQSGERSSRECPAAWRAPQSIRPLAMGGRVIQICPRFIVYFVWRITNELY